MLNVNMEGFEISSPVSAIESIDDFFYTLFQNNPVATLLFDQSIRLVAANQTTFEYFYQQEKSVLGALFGNTFQCTAVKESGLKCGETEECRRCMIRNSITNTIQSGLGFRNAEVEHEFMLNGRPDRKWFSVNASPITHNGEVFTLVTMMDVTEYKKREKKLFLLGITDELTGLFNRRYIMEQLTVQQTLAQQSGTPFCLSVLDIDNFKKINDVYGHLTGDTVLRHLARIIRENIRFTDFAGRYGGEEFLLIFPNCKEETGRKIIERINHLFQTGEIESIPCTVTFSAGLVEVSGFNHCSDGPNALFSQADNLLLLAKANGKNRVESTILE